MLAGESIAITTPGINTSRGHELTMHLFEQALLDSGAGINPADITHLTLKPETYPAGPIGFACRKAWEGVENGKMKLAAKAEGLLERTMGRVIGTASTIVRNSNSLNLLLSAVHRERLAALHPKHSISSHYLTFWGDHSQGTKRVFVGPDICPQPAAIHIMQEAQERDQALTVVSSSHIYSNLLKGVNPERIKTTGLVVPNNVYNAIPLRIAKQEAVKRGEVLPSALVKIGASAPEHDQVRALVHHLIEQEIPTTVLCGEDNSNNTKFRHTLETDNRERRQTRQGLLAVVGATAGFSRRDEILAYTDAIANPDFTIFATRPSETAVVAGALGAQHVVLDFYQDHERRAAEYLTTQSHAVGARRMIAVEANYQALNYPVSSFGTPDFPFWASTGANMLTQVFGN